MMVAADGNLLGRLWSDAPANRTRLKLACLALLEHDTSAICFESAEGQFHDAVRAGRQYRESG